MKVNEIMTTNIIYADKDTEISEVCSLMKTYDIGFLPIKKKNKYIGVVTDRDIIIRGIANNLKPSTQINNVITDKIISVNSKSDIEEALQLMSEYQIKRLLVTQNNKYIGIISLSDILSVNHPFNALEYISDIFLSNNKTNYENEIDLPQAEINEFEL